MTQDSELFFSARTQTQNNRYGPEPTKEICGSNSNIMRVEVANELQLEDRVRNLLKIEQFRNRVEAIYQKHNPIKLKDPKFLDTILSVYAENENLLLQQLIAKYGDEEE